MAVVLGKSVRSLGRDPLKLVPYLIVALVILAAGWWIGASRASATADAPYAGTLRDLNGKGTVACVYPDGEGPGGSQNWCGYIVLGSRTMAPVHDGQRVHAVLRQINGTTVIVVTP